MAVFAVIGAEPNDALASAVAAEFKDKSFTIAPGQFLVVGDRITPGQISAKLGGPTGAVGSILVLLVTTYSGFHTQEIWDWLALQQDAFVTDALSQRMLPPIHNPLAPLNG